MVLGIEVNEGSMLGMLLGDPDTDGMRLGIDDKLGPSENEGLSLGSLDKDGVRDSEGNTLGEVEGNSTFMNSSMYTGWIDTSWTASAIVFMLASSASKVLSALG